MSRYHNIWKIRFITRGQATRNTLCCMYQADFFVLCISTFVQKIWAIGMQRRTPCQPHQASPSTIDPDHPYHHCLHQGSFECLKINKSLSPSWQLCCLKIINCCCHHDSFDCLKINTSLLPSRQLWLPENKRTMQCNRFTLWRYFNRPLICQDVCLKITLKLICVKWKLTIQFRTQLYTP